MVRIGLKWVVESMPTFGEVLGNKFSMQKKNQDFRLKKNTEIVKVIHKQINRFALTDEDLKIIDN